MISKELLNEVLGTKTIQMNPVLEDNNMVGYLVYGSQDTITQIRNNHKQINICELAYKCKEWAYNDKSLCGYSIELKSYKSEIGCWLCELMSEDITFSGDTEPDVIFKACQWILDNKSHHDN